MAIRDYCSAVGLVATQKRSSGRNGPTRRLKHPVKSVLAGVMTDHRQVGRLPSSSGSGLDSLSGAQRRRVGKGFLDAWSKRYNLLCRVFRTEVLWTRAAHLSRSCVDRPEV